jgi:ferredoxin
MKRVMSVGVIQDTCLAHWCCLVAPRVFRDIGEPWPVLPENVETFLDSDRNQVIEAVLGCPVAALWLEFEDGRTISSLDYDPRAGIKQWLDY